jgi:protein gp37
MSDLFHQNVPLDFIDNVFAVMAAASHHKFQVLTKRPGRMSAYFARSGVWGKVQDTMFEYFDPPREVDVWPLPNVWLGVSVEDQKTADERIPLLLQTLAAVRFVSCEPLLGPVDLRGSLSEWGPGLIRDYLENQNVRRVSIPKLDWVIAGGESGPGARPMHPDWARGLRNQCQAAGVPFFFKQWGEWHEHVANGPLLPHCWWMEPDGTMKEDDTPSDDAICVGRIGKKVAGRLLDGRTWDEFPK